MERQDLSKFVRSLGYQDLADQKEYLSGVIAHLEAISNRRLDASEVPSWTQRLSRYHRKKLSELGNYSGMMNGQVFQYLDSIQLEPPVYEQRQIPDYTPNEKKMQIAKDFGAHIEKVMNFNGSREERLKWEWNSFVELDKKYPHLSVLSQVINEKRFDGIRPNKPDYKSKASGE